MDKIKYFDGHNDVLLKLFYSKSKDPTEDFFNGNNYCHIDYKKVKISNFIGGFFAIFVPDKEPQFNFFSRMESESYDFPLPDEIPYEKAINATEKMIDILNKIIKNSGGEIVLCKNGKELIDAYDENKIAIILHIEGAEAIDKDFRSLEKLYELGLRSIGLVWSRSNIFATGVPFSFPKTPDIGPGLTSIGKELVKICDNKNILIDLSHLNEKGFWDVADLSTKPLIATHSNVFTLSKSPRNLTDRQLDAIKDSQGLVGLNFATGFLREDGKNNKETPVSVLIKHLDLLLEKLGENGVALGSDFDGAAIPNFMVDCSGLQKLVTALHESGYGEPLITKICRTNWINMISKIIK